MGEHPSLELIVLVTLFLIFLGRVLIGGFADEAGRSAWKKLTRNQNSLQIDLTEASVEELLIKSVDEEKLFELLRERIEDVEREEMAAFLSYSIQDEEYAKDIRNELEKRSYETITPLEKISVGDSIPDRLLELMQQADFMIVLLSETSLNSGWVRQELGGALRQEMDDPDFLVIPVLIEEIDRPLDLEVLRAKDSISDTVDAIDQIVQAHYQ